MNEIENEILMKDFQINICFLGHILGTRNNNTGINI